MTLASRPRIVIEARELSDPYESRAGERADAFGARIQVRTIGQDIRRLQHRIRD